MQSTDVLHAHISIECYKCRTNGTREDIPLFSERTLRIHCAQCAYQILEVIFRFEKTNLGIYLEKRHPAERNYNRKFFLTHNDVVHYPFKSISGETAITIKGNQ